MRITRNKTTDQIQSEFKSLYPKLKIEFYSTKHEIKEGSKDSTRIMEETVLSALNPDMKDAEINIVDEMEVGELEMLFEERFGLHIQIFRKSGDQWMQTSITDNWSLGKQEKKGEDLDRFLAEM